jgi:hypothetical protein
MALRPHSLPSPIQLSTSAHDAAAIAQQRTSPTSLAAPSTTSPIKQSSPLLQRKDRLQAKAVDAAHTVATRYSGYKSTLNKMWQKHTDKHATTAQPKVVTPSRDGTGDTMSINSFTDDTVDSIEVASVAYANELTPFVTLPPTLQRSNSFTCGEKRRHIGDDIAAKTARQLRPTASLPRSRSDTNLVVPEISVVDNKSRVDSPTFELIDLPEPTSPVDDHKPVNELHMVRRLVTSAKACAQVECSHGVIYQSNRLSNGVSRAKHLR